MAKTKQDAELLSAYAAVGDDALKRDTVAKRLRARLEKLGDLSFNYDEFDAETAEEGAIVGACNTIPFASPVRMVRVKQIDKLRKADADALTAYLGAPCPSTVLLLEGEKLSKATRLGKAVAALGAAATIDCSSPKRNELPRLVRSMAVSQGITLTEGAARLLVELAGEDTVRLNAELEKIALAHRGADAVNEHEVSALVSRTNEAKPWDLLDALSARNAKRCFACLAAMPSASPHALIASGTGRIRELIAAKALDARGAGGQLAAALKKRDWQVKNHRQWARRFTDAELRDALVRARDAERAMKSGADEREAYLDWLCSVLQAERPAR